MVISCLFWRVNLSRGSQIWHTPDSLTIMLSILLYLPQNFEAELRGRELVISNLKEAGEGLISEADNHPNSDKIDILERHNKALDYWDSLLNKHKLKTSALEELERKIDNLSQDVREVEGRFEVVIITPDSISPAEKSLDKMLKDIVAMVDYSVQLEERIEEESMVTCSEDFQPLIVSRYLALVAFLTLMFVLKQRKSLVYFHNSNYRFRLKYATKFSCQ